MCGVREGAFVDVCRCVCAGVCEGVRLCEIITSGDTFLCVSPPFCARLDFPSIGVIKSPPP